MKVEGVPYRSLWLHTDGCSVDIIDQTKLPHGFVVKSLQTVGEAAEAISVMRVRGAPLIGATAAYGMALAMKADDSDESKEDEDREVTESVIAARPWTPGGRGGGGAMPNKPAPRNLR